MLGTFIQYLLTLNCFTIFLSFNVFYTNLPEGRKQSTSVAFISKIVQIKSGYTGKHLKGKLNQIRDWGLDGCTNV